MCVQASDLKRHERVHSGERPFVCEICDRRFAQGSSLKAHMRCHTNERPYACLHCDRTFIQSSNVYNHMRSHEDTDTVAQYRRYSCALCDKSFVNSNVLRVHLRTHTGERPHSCPQCSRSFAQESNLRRHYRTHTGEKPFVCGICLRGFTQSNNLKAHMSVRGVSTGGGHDEMTSCRVKGQTIYNCDECDSQFLRRSNLDKHKVAAHGEQRRIVVIAAAGQRIDALMLNLSAFHHHLMMSMILSVISLSDWRCAIRFTLLRPIDLFCTSEDFCYFGCMIVKMLQHAKIVIHFVMLFLALCC